MNTVIDNTEMTNCTQCRHHEVIPDPDPYDSFNADDMAVVCKKTDHNPNFDPESHYHATRQNQYRCVTVSCRPYSIIKECDIPDWCPLLPKAKHPLEAIADSIAENMQEIRNSFKAVRQ